MPTGCRPDVGGAARVGVVMSTNYKLKRNYIRLSFAFRGHDERRVGPLLQHRVGIHSASMDADWMPTGWECDAKSVIKSLPARTISVGEVV